MKKHVYGRQFKRDVNERKALFRSLLSELVMHERIQTTEEKAKAIKADADKLITRAKKNDIRQVYALLTPLVTTEAVKKLMVDLAPRFADRPGGYTRIIRLERRFNDNAKMAFIEWTEKSAIAKIQSEKLPKKSKSNTKESTTQMNAATSTQTPKTKEAKKDKKITSKKAPAKKVTTVKEETSNE